LLLLLIAAAVGVEALHRLVFSAAEAKVMSPSCSQNTSPHPFTSHTHATPTYPPITKHPPTHSSLFPRYTPRHPTTHTHTCTPFHTTYSSPIHLTPLIGGRKGLLTPTPSNTSISSATHPLPLS
jgi:hypothetical protein